MKKFLTFILSVLIALAVGGLSALLTMNNMDIYSRIVSPPLAPPAILFPIVWSILFVLMGISSAIIFLSKSSERDDALYIYVISLVLNFSWTIFFFNFEQFVGSLVIIITLWISILLTIIKYYKINKVASLIQIPYLIWVTFATYLNLAIAILN